MSGCINLRIGHSNRMEQISVLASDPTSSTPINNIENEYASRRAYWAAPNSSGNIIIGGTMTSPQYSQFMAVPSVRTMGEVEMKLELFLAPDTATDLLAMPFTSVLQSVATTTQIPLGTYRVGIDPYGSADPSIGTNVETFVYWFSQRIYYDSFRLTIRRATESPNAISNVGMRQLFLGDMLEMESNFSYGCSVSFLSDPELKKTSSGSWVKTKRQIKSRRINLPMGQMTDNDYAALQYVESLTMGDPFIVSAFPTDRNDALYNHYSMMARFDSELGYAYRFIKHHQTNISLVEV